MSKLIEFLPTLTTNLLATILTSFFLVLPTSQAEDLKLSLSGSSTLAPLASEIAKLLEKKNPGLRVDVQTGGSSRGIADVQRGLVDLGMSSRSLYKKERSNTKSHVVAYDGVAFVVHKDNPLRNLSKDQARKIYLGEISNWRDLGGADATITVIDRAKGRSEKDLVDKFLEIEAGTTKASVIAGENQQCVKLIEGNKNAIVYLSIGTAEYEKKRSGKLKLLSLDTVDASSATVKNKSYPLRRPLLLVSKKELRGATKKFLELALSKEVNLLVEQQAFVPIN